MNFLLDFSHLDTFESFLHGRCRKENHTISGVGLSGERFALVLVVLCKSKSCVLEIGAGPVARFFSHSSGDMYVGSSHIPPYPSQMSETRGQHGNVAVHKSRLDQCVHGQEHETVQRAERTMSA